MNHLRFIWILGLLSGISFSQSSTEIYAIKKNDTLRMDIYMPTTVGQMDGYPVLLWMHGGGFAGGSRDNDGDKRLFKYATDQGYVAISISYRLSRKGKESGFGCNCPSEEKLNTFKMAVEDYMDAAKYIIQNSQRLKLNTNNIIAAGSSAGAEGILNSVFMREYFIDDIEKYSTVKFIAAFSLAGALVDSDYIVEGNQVPTIMFHGTNDMLVPFGTAPHHFCKNTDPGYLILEGPSTIADRLRSLGESFLLHVVTGGGHEQSEIPISRLEEVFDFFDMAIQNSEKRQLTIIKSREK